MKKHVFAVALAATALSFGQAQAEGAYIGGSVGQSVVDIDDVSAPGVTSTKDDTDTATKFFVGIPVNRNFAIELGYMDLGESALTLRTGGFTNKMTFSATALHVDAVGKLDVTPTFAILLRGGVARTSFKVEDVDNGIFCNCTINTSKSGTSIKYGAGVEFALDRSLSLRGEYEVVADVGDEETYGESDVSMMSIGLAYAF